MIPQVAPYAKREKAKFDKDRDQVYDWGDEETPETSRRLIEKKIKLHDQESMLGRAYNYQGKAVPGTVFNASIEHAESKALGR